MIEITTLFHDIDYPRHREESDIQLAAFLNNDWQILNITIEASNRIVTLAREVPDA